MINPSIIPVSAIIPTKDRLVVLIRTINNILDQSYCPSELIIIDASDEDHGDEIWKVDLEKKKGVKFIYVKAVEIGAAKQRMQGMLMASHSVIWFLDDDLLLEQECTKRLWEAFSYKDNVGGVNAMIRNQRYTNPGWVTHYMYQLMLGKKLKTYAGKVIGPAWNLLPEDEPDLPDYVFCEWLNTTCTMYKRDALPNPVFPTFFTGYSLMEDVALSLMVAKKYTLLNARTARIFHDSQPGAHKDRLISLSQMELVNRHYVMTEILCQTSFKSYLKLFIFELFGLVSGLRSWDGIKKTPYLIWGKLTGILKIIKKGNSDLMPKGNN